MRQKKKNKAEDAYFTAGGDEKGIMSVKESKNCVNSKLPSWRSFLGDLLLKVHEHGTLVSE